MIEPMDELEPLLTAQQLAAYLNVPLATLYAWRYRREGPPGFPADGTSGTGGEPVRHWIDIQLGDPGGLDSRSRRPR